MSDIHEEIATTYTDAVSALKSNQTDTSFERYAIDKTVMLIAEIVHTAESRKRAILWHDIQMLIEETIDALGYDFTETVAHS